MGVWSLQGYNHGVGGVAPGSPEVGARVHVSAGSRPERAVARGEIPLAPERPLQEPRWTPRDRKCPPMGTGGAGPAAVLPVPTRRRRAAPGPSLCVARGAGPARPLRPAVARPARSTR